MLSFGVELTQREQIQFDWLFTGVGINLLLETPRDIHRLVNRVICRLVSIGNELDFSDLVGVELVALKFPKLASLIGRQWDDFVSVSHTDREIVPEGMEQLYILKQISRVPDEDTSDLAGDGSTIIFRSCLEAIGTGALTEIGMHAYTRLLEFLFPGLTGHATDGQPDYTSAKRLCTRRGMLVWLHGGMSPVTTEVADCFEFLEYPDRRRVILAGWKLDNQQATKLEFCIQELANMTVQNREELCMLLLESSSSEDTESIVRFLIALLRSVAGEAGRERILRTIVSSCGGVDISRNVLMCVLTAAGICAEGRFYKPGEDVPNRRGQELLLLRGKLYELVNVWVTTVRGVVKSDTFLDSTLDPVGILCTWGQLGGNDLVEVHHLIGEKCQHQRWLSKFVSKLNPEAPIPDCVPRDFLSVLREAVDKCPTCKKFLESYDGGAPKYRCE